MKIKQHFHVLGKKWTAVLMTNKKYRKKKSRKNSVAVTYCHKRKICFNPKGLDTETVLHELTHAYLYEMCFHSCNEITQADLEEIFAELLSKRGEEMLDLADDLIHEFKEQMNEIS